MTTWIAVACAYLLGSISFGVVVSKLFGLADPRSFGSGNPGATNVLRTGNKTAALLVLLGDALKGFIAVYVAKAFASQYGLDGLAITLVAIAVFVGHLFPVWHKFQGGKGVATAAGVLLALSPLFGLAVLMTWVIIAFFFRYSSLAALIAAVFAPMYYLFLFGTRITALAVFVISVLLIWRHAGNIGRLIAGKESRIGGQKLAATGPIAAKTAGKKARKKK
ncbi:MAG: glycerol-3-phosphate 1-O-acyltransferase PlsY [Burkholderiaceae bacterium]